MKKGYVYIILTAFIFSTMEIAGKMVVGELNSFQVTFLRFLIGAVMLFPFAIKDLKRKNLKLKKKDLLYFIFTGTICVPISMALLQIAVEYTKEASITAVIFCTNPIFTIPFAVLLLKDKITKQTIYSIVLCIIGILFIFNPFKMNVDVNVIKGMLIALASAISFSLYTVVSKKKLKVYGGSVFNFFTFFIGDLVLLIFLLLKDIPIISGITTKNIPTILYMGIIITGVGYIFYLKAIEETSPIKASTAFFIKPALAPILALIFLKENLTINIIAGICFIIIGSIIGSRKSTKYKVQSTNKEIVP
ncbi:DMT family transporter [Haloimpatiens sp. FM7330]|uniref:DMT family transporter n=1 Tax=Haloimpatiens sp. FM7330 TaxID=3298610 RepID=UPI0036440F2E